MSAPSPIEIVAVPKRPEGAEAGRAFARQIEALPLAERHAAATREILAGNVPDHLRTWWPVEVGDSEHEVFVWVSPRYLSVGTDSDHLLMPLDLVSAAQIALSWGCGLPTRRIADAIFEAAAIRTAPAPLEPGPEMASIGYAWREQRAIESQLDGKTDLVGLFAGQKKDLVLTPMLRGHPRREAIYGWHRAKGDAIQPLSIWHLSTYSDYSHGVRLVFEDVLVDGELTSLWQALADETIGPLLSDEGPLPDAQELLRAVKP